MLKSLYKPTRLSQAFSTSTCTRSADSMAAVRTNITFQYSSQQKHSLTPLIDKLTKLPLVQDMEANTSMKLEAFYWPSGIRRLQAPFSLAYGALAGSKDLPLLPLVYRWKSLSLPNHLDVKTYHASFATQPQSFSVPGVTMIQHLGPGLKFNGVGEGSRGIVHPGVLSALLDDVTVRVSLSNIPDKPAFTANFQLEYLHQVPTDSFVVLDAWMTKIDGRKTFITSYIADAITQKVLVRAKSLFVCSG